MDNTKTKQTEWRYCGDAGNYKIYARFTGYIDVIQYKYILPNGEELGTQTTSLSDLREKLNILYTLSEDVDESHKRGDK